jgi:hypothetical protein
MKAPRKSARRASPTGRLPLAIRRDLMGSDPSANLHIMEREARRSLAFGADLDFDADRWELGAAKSTSSRVSNAISFTRLFPQQRTEIEEPIPEEFALLIKIICRLRQAAEPASPALFERILLAARLLYEALHDRGYERPCELRSTDFRAAERLASTLGYKSVYLITADLRKIAKAVVIYRLAYEFIEYRPAEPTPITSGHLQPGEERAVPSPAAFAALREIEMRATEPVDLCPLTPIIIARAVPSRIGELLPLAVDCERVFVDGTPGEMSDLDDPQGREVRYAIEYFDEKAQRFQNKFVPSDAVPTVRRAIENVRRITAPSRAVAKHYAANPGTAWLPESLREADSYTLPQLADALWMSQHVLTTWCSTQRIPIADEYVRRTDLADGLMRARPTGRKSRQATLAAAGALLDGAPHKVVFTASEIDIAVAPADGRRLLRQLGVPVQPRSVTRPDLEQALIRLQPRQIGLPQPLERCLFVLPLNFLHRGRQAFLPVAELMTTDQVRIFLTGADGILSVFDRFEFHEENGDAILISSRMFRNWLVGAARTSKLTFGHTKDWTRHKADSSLRAYDRPTQEHAANQAARAFDLMGSGDEDVKR